MIPLSPDNSQAVNIVQNTLKGRMMPLTKNVLDAIQIIFKKHLTQKKDQKQVTHGGDNIIYGCPHGIQPWDGLNKGKFKPLHNALNHCVKEMWKGHPKAIKNLPVCSPSWDLIIPKAIPSLFILTLLKLV